MEFFIKLAVFIFISEHTTLSWFVCPRNCDCEGQTVDCSYRGFKEFPTYFPPHADYLNLSGNELHYLPDALYNLQTLAHLNLARNQIRYVPETTLIRLLKLETLDLSGNKISRLPNIHGILYLRQLRELSLQNNPIIETGSCQPDDTLGSETINKLDLSNCMLTNINTCAFLWLTNLTHLYLSGNPLQQLTQIVSNTIEHLEMSNCDINYVSVQFFEKLPSLKYLDLSKNYNLKLNTLFNNRLGYISESLQHLDISHCGMTEPTLSSFPSIKTASFKGNFIRELPSKLLQNNKNLISLDLSENLIRKIHYGTFIGADSLKSLDLSSNFITDFHLGTFSNLYSLNKLNLSRNQLKSINNVSSFTLQHLDVSDCNIRELNTVIPFCIIPNALTLNISNNPLEYLPNELCLDHLEELDISYCRITMIKSKTFERLTKLKKLNLQGNRLTNTFQHSVMFSMINIEEIIVSNNPWQCRCNSTDQIEFLSFVTKRSPKADQQGPTCLMSESQLQVIWMKTCLETETKEVKKMKSERHWTAFLVTFAVMSSIVVILLILRQNLSFNRATSTSAEHNETLEINQTPYPVRSPISDILQLPTYDEAILLPKPTHAIDFLNGRTREAATWTSNQCLNNCDDNDNINNDSSDTEISPLRHQKDEINVSSTSL